ncbi:ABC transporter permease [Kaistia sp. 32K]|uniref:ABC transporter permease n=1 Tax=Kaistia sp. 32K TaxID=2795690 RepID=UPI0019165C2D|nr:ABC transporter permease [Kaistia sp. 32K]BCP52172.1 ABC transporter permease [Kaistia sp. 32K]
MTLSEASIGSWRRGIRRATRGLSASGWVGAAIILVYIGVALTGPLWAPYGAAAILTGNPFEGGSLQHLFGTDNLGRDVFSRVVLGTRSVLTMTFAATFLALAIGGLIGIVLGYIRGWIDELGMRIIDILISIPTLVLALLIISALGNSLWLVVLTVAFLFVPRVARVARAATLNVSTHDYVAAARARGETTLSICLHEILPNILGVLLVEFAIRSAFAIIFIGSLGFLGFGAPPPTPEWGLMINEARANATNSLWPVLAPAAVMAVLIIGINLFADGLSRRLDHPGHRTSGAK